MFTFDHYEHFKQYPEVSLHIHQGSPTQIYDALLFGELILQFTTKHNIFLMTLFYCLVICGIAQ